MVESQMRKSVLGSLALLAGIAALVLTRFNPTGITMITVGTVKLALPAAVALGASLLAAIAFVAAASSPRTGTGLPILALLVCGGAVLFAFHPDWLSRSPKSNGNPPASTTLVPPITTPTPPAVEDNPPTRQKTIFDSDYPSSTPPPLVKKEPMEPAPDSPAAPAVNSTPPPVHFDRNAEITAARANLDSARSAVTRALESAPEYQAAKAQADAADAELKRARLAYEAGSPELISASQAALNAHGKLRKLVADATAKDPASQEAAKELQRWQSQK
jgi:hypothetical protein